MASPSITGGGGAGGATTFTIVAQGSAWDQSTLSFPASIQVTVVLDNRDAGVPHNFSIYRDEGHTDSVFKGEIVNGPGTIDNVIPPLDPGTYYFQCDVHGALMAGTISVG
jgi:plastocyanin